MGAWSGSVIQTHSEPKNMKVRLSELFAEKLGMDPYDITFLLGCIDENSSESVEKQLRALILTLKLEYGDQLADKKTEIEREKQRLDEHHEQMLDEIKELREEIRQAEKDWYDKCWNLVEQIQLGEKIKFDKNNEVHLALLHTDIIRHTFFSNRLKLVKPLHQISMAGVRDPDTLVGLRHRKKLATEMLNFTLGRGSRSFGF